METKNKKIEVYEGQVKDGKKEGFGTIRILNENYTYEGFFVNDNKNGQFMEIHNGSIKCGKYDKKIVEGNHYLWENHERKVKPLP